MFDSKINDVNELQKLAKNIRKSIIEMVYKAQSGHPRRFIICGRYINSIVF